MTITIRKTNERGHADHGWLNSYHTFSFADYYDSRFQGFNSLLVINEDRVAPGEGFGAHPHSEMEIFSYIISGALEHKDSMGNKEILKRGDVQFTSAGTGIFHSEYNGSEDEWVYFLQIWVEPDVNRLQPSYQTKHFTDDEKRGKLCLIVSPDESDNTVKIHQDLHMYASILQPDDIVSHTFTPERAGYIHVTDTKGSRVIINDSVVLKSGDGAFISGEQTVNIVGLGARSEFVFFDMARQ